MENFAQSRGPKNPHALGEAAPIDRTELRDVDDARKQESGLTTPEANIPGHGRQPKIGRHRRDNNGGNRATVEPIVLHDQSRSAPRWLRPFRSAEV
jgi:hypothetical protein